MLKCTSCDKPQDRLYTTDDGLLCEKCRDHIPVDDIVTYRQYVNKWFETKQITKTTHGCHIWHGRWRDQPEAKIKGKRQGIRPIIYAAHNRHKIPPKSKVVNLCENALCVNPVHMYTVARDKTLVRSSRTKTNRTYRPNAEYGDIHTPHIITADRMESSNIKRTQLKITEAGYDE